MSLAENFKPLHSVSPNVLVVIEDSEEDIEILLRAVKKSAVTCQIKHYEMGQDALEYLFDISKNKKTTEFKQPSLILLDLNLPGMDGRTVLEKIKSDPILKLIPVVIFSTSSNPKDVEDCYSKGANAYVIKPMDVELLTEYVKLLLLHWLEVNVSCIA